MIVYGLDPGLGIWSSSRIVDSCDHYKDIGNGLLDVNIRDMEPVLGSEWKRDRSWPSRFHPRTEPNLVVRRISRTMARVEDMDGLVVIDELPILEAMKVAKGANRGWSRKAILD